MSAVTRVLLIIFFILIVVGVGIGFYFFIRSQNKVPQPNLNLCISTTPITYFDTSPRYYDGFFITKDFCAKNTTPLFTFSGYDQPVDGTTAWCVSNFRPVSSIDVIADHARFTEGTTCDNSKLVMYLPTSQDFSPDVVPIYVYTLNVSGTAEGNSVNFNVYQYSLTEVAGSDQQLAHIVYAFPAN